MYHSLPLFPSFPCLVPRNKLPPTPEKTQRAATQKKTAAPGQTSSRHNRLNPIQVALLFTGRPARHNSNSAEPAAGRQAKLDFSTFQSATENMNSLDPSHPRVLMKHRALAGWLPIVVCGGRSGPNMHATSDPFAISLFPPDFWRASKTSAAMRCCGVYIRVCGELADPRTSARS